jgi:hypothetical protein
MRVHGVWQAAAASLWLFAVSAPASAEPRSAPATEVNAGATAEPETASQETAAATQRTSEAPVELAAKPWDTLDDGQRLELKIVPSTQLDWSPEKRARGSMQRAIGYVVGGLGVVGLATSGVFGYRAIDFNQRALDQCHSPDPSNCTGDGKDSRDMAKAFAGGAMISLAAGAALLFSGIALIVHAPKNEPSHGFVSDLRLSAMPSLKGANVRLVGAW